MSKNNYELIREEAINLNNICIWSKKSSINEHNIFLLNNRDLSSDIFNLNKLKNKHTENLNNPFEKNYSNIRTMRLKILQLEYDMKTSNIVKTIYNRKKLSDPNYDPTTIVTLDQQSEMIKIIEEEIKDLNLLLEKELKLIAPNLLPILFSVIITEDSSNGVNMKMVIDAINKAEQTDKGKITVEQGMEIGFKFSEDNYKLPKDFFEPLKKDYKEYKRGAN